MRLESLRDHLGVCLTLLRGLMKLESIEVSISDTERNDRRIAAAERGVIGPLAAQFPGASLRIDHTREQGRSYYSGLCLRIDMLGASGEAGESRRRRLHGLDATPAFRRQGASARQRPRPGTHREARARRGCR